MDSVLFTFSLLLHLLVSTATLDLFTKFPSNLPGSIRPTTALLFYSPSGIGFPLSSTHMRTRSRRFLIHTMLLRQAIINTYINELSTGRTHSELLSTIIIKSRKSFLLLHKSVCNVCAHS